MQKIKVIKYKDSAITSEQTDEICQVFIMTAVGFVISDSVDQIVIAQELMSNGHFRAQLAIPREAIVSIKDYGKHA